MKTDPIVKQQKRGSTLIWLSYTAFLFLDPIFEPSLHLWLETLGVFAIFLVIFYFYVTCGNKPLQFWMILATLALGMFTLPWNSGGMTFFIYAAGFFPFFVAPKAWSLLFFAAESIILLLEPRILHFNTMSGYMGIFLVLAIGGSNIFFAEQKRADSKLRLAHEEIEALAALAERERIARDLHDVLGHTLSLIVLKAELAGRLIQRDPIRAASEINDVERTARTALAEVREAIGGYRSRGLVAEIETARRTLDSANVTLFLDSGSSNNTSATPDLDPEMWQGEALTAAEETVLALALREAVTNIVRHARASTCRLRFVSDHGHRRLLIEDDGDHPLAREGNGLRGMRERVEALGGKLSLTRNNGTHLLIELPTTTPS